MKYNEMTTKLAEEIINDALSKTAQEEEVSNEQIEITAEELEKFDPVAEKLAEILNNDDEDMEKEAGAKTQAVKDILTGAKIREAYQALRKASKGAKQAQNIGVNAKNSKAFGELAAKRIAEKKNAGKALVREGAKTVGAYGALGAGVAGGVAGAKKINKSAEELVAEEALMKCAAYLEEAEAMEAAAQEVYNRANLIKMAAFGVLEDMGYFEEEDQE